MSLEYQEWRYRRVKFTSLFTSGKMKMMFEIINGIGDRLVKEIAKQIKKSECQELKDWSQRFTTDAIGNVAFGIDCNCE
jgi:cytochrome P450 family 6